MDKLLLETDCPVYYGRGTRYRSAPGDITRSLGAVAQLKRIDEAAVAEYTTRNAIELFSLENVIASPYCQHERSEAISISVESLKEE